MLFCSFQLFGNGHIHNVVSTLINVVKLNVENNSIVSTVVFINVEIDNVDLALFNIVNFNVDIHNFASTLILTLSDVGTSYHPNSNVETTLKGFLGIDKCRERTT